MLPRPLDTGLRLWTWNVTQCLPCPLPACLGANASWSPRFSGPNSCPYIVPVDMERRRCPPLDKNTMKEHTFQTPRLHPSSFLKATTATMKDHQDHHFTWTCHGLVMDLYGLLVFCCHCIIVCLPKWMITGLKIKRAKYRTSERWRTMKYPYQHCIRLHPYILHVKFVSHLSVLDALAYPVSILFPSIPSSRVFHMNICTFRYTCLGVTQFLWKEMSISVNFTACRKSLQRRGRFIFALGFPGREANAPLPWFLFCS